MEHHVITIDGNEHVVQDGMNLLTALQEIGARLDAPCNGMGACRKCIVLIDGAEVLACQTIVHTDLEVVLPSIDDGTILASGTHAEIAPDNADAYALAFDIGTTTVVCYLLDGSTGEVLATASRINPQESYGADVISRIQWVKSHGKEKPQENILAALDELAREAADKAGIDPALISCACVVGNTCMHHLALGIDTAPLSTPPYMPLVSHALELEAADYISVLAPDARLRVLPNIAGFVGADTVACLVACDFDSIDELTLLIDIGTNGEMVLGDKSRRIACSTAAGPAFEGALIECGMRGAPGAIDHVFLDEGKISYSTVGNEPVKGICGSGLIDAVAVLLEAEAINARGQLRADICNTLAGCIYEERDGKKMIFLADGVYISQMDIRKIQMAKGAIRAGIELMAEQLDVKIGDVDQVFLAGAFGNYLDAASACKIGMLPPELSDRIVGIGNAAGEGAKACVLSQEQFDYAKRLASETEFLELASLPEFQDRYIACTYF